MDITRFVTQRNIIIVCVILIVGLISFATWQSISLRIVSTTPDVNRVSNAEPFIDLNFNHDLARAEGIKIHGTDSEFEIVNNKTLRINLAELQDNTENPLTITTVTAKNGKQLKDIKLTLHSRYIDYNEMNPEAQKEAVNQSNSGQSSDQFFIKNSFPLEGDGFVIRDETVEYDWPILDVTFDEEIAPGPDQPRPQMSNERALAMQQTVLTFIREKGGDPDKYHIDYSNDYLNSFNPTGD